MILTLVGIIGLLLAANENVGVVNFIGVALFGAACIIGGKR